MSSPKRFYVESNKFFNDNDSFDMLNGVGKVVPTDINVAYVQPSKSGSNFKDAQASIRYRFSLGENDER